MPIVTTLTGGLTSPYAARLIGNVSREAYEKLADDILLPSLRSELPGHFGKTVKKKITGQGLNVQMSIYSDAPGIKQIEEGRPAGKKGPPLKAILKFVQKKGLGARAQSVKTRRSLAVGIARSFDRKAGKLRTRTQSLLARQKSIAFAISRNIAREGLPRNTGFPPSHNLRLFENLKSNHASEVNASTIAMQERIAAILNA
jgi:hypothetical protein